MVSAHARDSSGGPVGARAGANPDQLRHATPPTRQTRRYHEMVARADKVMRANLHRPFLISMICKSIGVSQRTLSRAFRATEGATPSRYIHELRLTEARKALLSANAAPDTVTEIALRFGFRELGRFAGAYRKRFGESPSTTLRHR
jgi:transcriptional regulator GlxA family with amidase domain